MGVFQKKACGLQSIQRILIYIRAFPIRNRSLHIKSNIWIRRRYRKFEYSVHADNPNVKPTNRYIRHHSNRHDGFLNSVDTLKMTLGFKYKQQVFTKRRFFEVGWELLQLLLFNNGRVVVAWLAWRQRYGLESWGFGLFYCQVLRPTEPPVVGYCGR
jgi:hypothetical protein